MKSQSRARNKTTKNGTNVGNFLIHLLTKKKNIKKNKRCFISINKKKKILFLFKILN